MNSNDHPTNAQPAPPEKRSTFEAYVDGLRAAWRLGRYRFSSSIPTNPYELQTDEAREWYRGLIDALDDIKGFKEIVRA
jgi:hypothetical protein